MKILLDTCTFLWIITDAPDLSQRARELFSAAEHEVYLSVVCSWEIAVKYALGKLPLPAAPEQYVPAQRTKHGILSLPLEEEASLYLGKLPTPHKDPFDRMLVCQTIVHGMTLLTPDPQITQYPVHTIW
ncbi:MAG: type II toxin-antitoxin system VapC family toxin [Deltaproteobacteria bacterium]|nr:type II toxin-antitoxin system VapC family toxin [Deltaproteobacteria bacterium]